MAALSVGVAISAGRLGYRRSFHCIGATGEDQMGADGKTWGDGLTEWLRRSSM